MTKSINLISILYKLINDKHSFRAIKMLAKHVFLCFAISLINIEHATAETDQVFISAGEKIYYQDTGSEQEAVILVHGFGMDSKMWKETGDYVLASVARGWALDSISFNQIEKITIPMQSVFGEQELARYSKDQLAALELPASATTIQIIKGADHDSKKAAVLHPDFLKAVLEFLAHNSN